jgi:hypothetical protein
MHFLCEFVSVDLTSFSISIFENIKIVQFVTFPVLVSWEYVFWEEGCDAVLFEYVN